MSNSAPKYLLDANVFIEAAKRYYAFDIAPGFWQALLHHAQTGELISIDRVKAEIDRGKDLLTKWANETFNQWFVRTDMDTTVIYYKEIMEWAKNQQQFTDAAKAEFADGENADAWVVAYALANGCVVATEERFNRNARKKIPIPNVCEAFNIRYIDTFGMLRELGVKL
ncbi:MAG: DUF4411 family protein [candidate division WOR-3 bacterium]